MRGKVAEAALFASQLLFDVVVYSLCKGALRPKDGIALVQNVLLNEA